MGGEAVWRWGEDAPPHNPRPHLRGGAHLSSAPPLAPCPPPVSRHLLRSGMGALPPGALLLGALLGERRGCVGTAYGERLGGGEGRRGALRAGGSGRGAGGAALAALLMSRCRPSGALGGDARGPRGSRGTAPRTAPWGRTPQCGRAVLCSHRGHFPADNSTSRSASSGKKSMYFFPVIKPAAPPCVRRCPRAAPPCPAPSVGFFPSFSLFLRVEGEV